MFRDWFRGWKLRGAQRRKPNPRKRQPAMWTSAAEIRYLEPRVLLAAPVVNDQTFTVAENTANGATIGTVVATDADVPPETLTYTITAGNGNNAIAIDAATGKMTVADSKLLDFETTPTFTLTVQVTDNGAVPASDTATITINLTNVEVAVTIDANNDLQVTSTGDGPDDLTLTTDGAGKTFIIRDATGELSSTIAAATVSADRKTVSLAFNAIPGDQIFVHLGGGNDHVTLQGGKYRRSLNIDGGTGTDTTEITAPLAIEAKTANNNFIPALSINVTGDLTAGSAIGANGQIDLIGGNIALDNDVRSTSLVKLNATQNISRAGGTVTANRLSITAGGAVGTKDEPLQTRVANLDGRAGSDVFVLELDGLTIGGADPAIQGLVTTGATSSITLFSKELTVSEQISAAGGDIRMTAFGRVQLNADVTTTGDVRLRAKDSITQDTGSLRADSFAVASLHGHIVLDSATNDVNTIAGWAGKKGKTITFRDTDDLTVGTLAGLDVFPANLVGIVAGRDLELRTGGALTVNAPLTSKLVIRLQNDAGDQSQNASGVITTSALGATSAGKLELTAATNHVKRFGGKAGTGTADLNDPNGFQTGPIPKGRIVDAVTP